MPAPKVYKEKEKILIVLEGSMLRDIEDYWHEKKLENRNAAIRELLTIALEKEQQG